ncbi:MAG: substrate-binding domain-containing protein, partial [Anaerolineales bacterium]
MRPIQPLRTYEHIKLLSDPRRMAILRLLMDAPATLTQLGAALGQTPAWVRHHIKTLEAAGLVEIVAVRANGIVTEKFYGARAGALLLQDLILPQTNTPTVVFSGSHDLALEHIAAALAPRLRLLSLTVGSLDGLVNLRQGLCHVAGAHLLGPGGAYNVSFIQHLFPDRLLRVMTLAHRTQGLIVAAGNPKGITSLFDLAREDVTFLNRNPGSGTRLWLERQLAQVGLPTAAIRGYERTVSTHSESAQAILQGKADAALGIQAAAHAHRLDFIPLFEERYDLAAPGEQTALLAPLFDFLQSAAARQMISALAGYDAAHSGEVVAY